MSMTCCASFSESMLANLGCADCEIFDSIWVLRFQRLTEANEDAFVHLG